MRREIWSIPKVKSSSSANVAMPGASLVFSVQYINDLWRNSKFLHRWTSIWKMFCKVLDKVIFMFHVAMCGMTWDCLNRWRNMLLASHQTTLETFVFISPVLHYISPVMNVCPEPAERNPILTGCEGASGWAASAPYCMLDTTWASLSSLSQYLSQEWEYLWKCHSSDWRRQSRLGICIAT